LALLKFQPKLTTGLQQMLRILQLNLFEKRDLMALLQGDPLGDNQMNINQMALTWKLTQTVVSQHRSRFAKPGG
jgi:hypothetical protein